MQIIRWIDVADHDQIKEMRVSTDFYLRKYTTSLTLGDSLEDYMTSTKMFA